ncbi:hypothetical protein [Pelosinus sp. sgz500959]|uniref:hypothetical protein n=1 Tax=Pelosinus sp. sgz500959 TaxID=3242472 RepID=UPI00366F08DB
MWRQIPQGMYFPNKCIGFYTALFMILWLGAWIMNGTQNSHFDLDRLRDSYIWLMTQLNATHAIDSIWNSPKGSNLETVAALGKQGNAVEQSK